MVVNPLLESGTSPKTAQAIHDRRRVNPVNSATWMATEDVLAIGRWKDFFFGFQLSLVDNIWNIDILGDLDGEFVQSNDILTDLPQSCPRVTNNRNQKVAVARHVLNPEIGWLAIWILA